MAEQMKKPVMTEVASTTTGSFVARQFTDVLTISDNIINERGGSYQIYREVLRDDQVASTFQQRRLALTSKEWDVEPGGKTAIDKAAAEALKENLNNIEWDRITDKMLYGIFYGFGVGEVMWEMKDGLLQVKDIITRDRERFRFGEKDKSQLYLIENPGTYKPMPDRKFWVVSTGADTDDEPYGLGLAHFLYWPVFFKRAGIKYWMIFLEKFGMPTTVAKAPWGDIQDKEKRDQILALLAQIQTDAGIVIPEGVELTLLEATRGGSASYDDVRKAMDNGIAKIVLSQVMTTEAAGGQYKADVHKDVRDEVIKADSDLMTASFNRSVAKWMTEFNFPGAKIPRVWRNTEPEEDLSERVTRDKGIYDLGYEPTEEYIEETYGTGWVKREMTGGEPFDQGDGEAPTFAELRDIAREKMGGRQDQADIVAAASAFASKYSNKTAERVEQILAYAEESDDYETFREKLNDLLGTIPGEDAIEPIQRGTFLTRLMGAIRGQK